MVFIGQERKTTPPNPSTLPKGIRAMLNFTPSTPFESIAHGHGTATTVGYIVRRTFFGGQRHEDAGEFRGNEYGMALERASEVRAEGHDGYAVIDNVYSCGCRGLG